MTKKHFVQFAKEIKALIDAGRGDEARAVAGVIIRVASNDNPQFDVVRFRNAAGLANLPTINVN